jgi:hypothetical protein
MINKIIYIILFLCCQISAQIPNKIVILHRSFTAETPFSIRCNDVIFEPNGVFKRIIIDKKEDLIKFQKIINKIRFTSTNLEPDVRVKIEAHYTKYKTTICLDEGNTLINGRPAEYSEGLILFVDSMKNKYKDLTGKKK